MKIQDFSERILAANLLGLRMKTYFEWVLFNLLTQIHLICWKWDDLSMRSIKFSKVRIWYLTYLKIQCIRKLVIWLKYEQQTPTFSRLARAAHTRQMYENQINSLESIHFVLYEDNLVRLNSAWFDNHWNCLEWSKSNLLLVINYTHEQIL